MHLGQPRPYLHASGPNFELLFLELGISRRALAAWCCIPQSSVARIETLQTIPKLDTLIKLMQALDLKIQVAAVG